MCSKASERSAERARGKVEHIARYGSKETHIVSEWAQFVEVDFPMLKNLPFFGAWYRQRMGSLFAFAFAINIVRKSAPDLYFNLGSSQVSVRSELESSLRINLKSRISRRSRDGRDIIRYRSFYEAIRIGRSRKGCGWCFRRCQGLGNGSTLRQRFSGGRCRMILAIQRGREGCGFRMAGWSCSRACGMRRSDSLCECGCARHGPASKGGGSAASAGLDVFMAIDCRITMARRLRGNLRGASFRRDRTQSQERLHQA